MERLAKISGAKIKHVAYKGSAPALLALMGGEINIAATSAMSAVGAIKTGKVRGLATLGLKRNEALPDLPTVAEQGFPGFSITNRYDLWAPAKTPAPILEAIHRVVSDGINTPQVKQRLAADGSEPADRMSRAELKKAVVREYAELERSVQELGLQFR
jgi:tripartite-type tricarboxylate transporter receptor subunit TctC